MTRDKFWRILGISALVMTVLNFAAICALFEVVLGSRNFQFYAGWVVGSLIMVFMVTSLIAVLVRLFRGRWMLGGYFVLLWILWLVLTAMMLSGTVLSETGAV